MPSKIKFNFILVMRILLVITSVVLLVQAVELTSEELRNKKCKILIKI